PASARLSASMIWLSVKRDFFIVEILLRDSLLLSALVLRGDYPAGRWMLTLDFLYVIRNILQSLARISSSEAA
ncbi:hypothetical protein, partial [Tepidimonas aquatica]|uniref:hypothetical protein n=1 Tax=Tepidimonas aquatica TaxID=247482 RepID=UPI001C8F4FA5